MAGAVPAAHLLHERPAPTSTSETTVRAVGRAVTDRDVYLPGAAGAFCRLGLSAAGRAEERFEEDGDLRYQRAGVVVGVLEFAIQPQRRQG
jgi:hypothetical protein